MIELKGGAMAVYVRPGGKGGGGREEGGRVGSGAPRNPGGAKQQRIPPEDPLAPSDP